MTKPAQPETPPQPAQPGVQPPQFTEPAMPDTAVPDGPAQSPDGVPAQDEGEKVTVTLAHHWTDPKTGENHLPESEVSLDADSAATLRAAGIATRAAE